MKTIITRKVYIYENYYCYYENSSIQETCTISYIKPIDLVIIRYELNFNVQNEQSNLTKVKFTSPTLRVKKKTILQLNLKKRTKLDKQTTQKKIMLILKKSSNQLNLHQYPTNKILQTNFTQNQQPSPLMPPLSASIAITCCHQKKNSSVGHVQLFQVTHVFYKLEVYQLYQKIIKFSCIVTSKFATQQNVGKFCYWPLLI
eukprot:TRINITY_DN6674_c0_g1_i3.p2 TRINITY_DN6674_c0_g1~~TRINITY_DN6674_c0_g1_i3.p2  ORF type:complete len:201 (+),score=-6.43 TRINITY_DN6674_c0_g1_i3:635-1237(+)